jgi:ferredoxin
VNVELCAGCATCLDACQFGALSLPLDSVQVNRDRCVGCGVCIPTCPSDALSLQRRPEAEILPIPEGESAWGHQRFAARGMMTSQAE